MRVIISSGTGFIGKFLVKELVNRDMKVTILTSQKHMIKGKMFQLYIQHMDMMKLFIN